MTPKRPIELVNLSKACAEAWARRDAMIDAEDKVGIEAMNLACDIIENMYDISYREWQILGGTSDIDSLAFPKDADPTGNNWFDFENIKEIPF